MNLNYRDAGVDILLADQWVETIRNIVRSMPPAPNVLGGIGGFSGLYRLPGGLVLAGCCDGVGTKIEVAKAAGKFDGIGQDLVAMNVNDLVTCGARPLFFLDYIACGRLKPEILGPIVESAARACRDSGCVLLGGETAEMPGTYGEDGLDLAGFSVGMLREDEIIDGSRIAPGDAVVGIPSSGVHSNGFSLVRKALFSSENPCGLSDTPEILERKTLGESLLVPTRLYVSVALEAARSGLVGGMAHITGGGLYDNIRRVIPGGLSLAIDYEAWPRPPIFSLLRDHGIDEIEMRRVFNLGIGFAFIVREEKLPEFLSLLEGLGEKGYVIGGVSA
ncbi:phosphoribosylformylglycinamidine cyclo-ligase [Aminivibrio sp.]|jgi:phosphoribosylformylglycinamidine cyclo-ligase|uniref:phosphoribosylformylglycinamidine cyclo-ligase n=1 Tax=Aminivibrio sp. TaxID=1872489 RepID=UPI001A601CEB|nr:phosphoribosylformylglycinamidine cyclo-ligase [Aminivibrio sp.]MBL3538550.1 phosphoribosylformylglycinamidine cyclo-ligase [Aminivibrio sp.]MDK2958081.1 phosphoribosylformylglycinamidine cyclo-ligase [Synergistaceae bacterium]